MALHAARETMGSNGSCSSILVVLIRRAMYEAFLSGDGYPVSPRGSYFDDNDDNNTHASYY